MARKSTTGKGRSATKAAKRRATSTATRASRVRRAASITVKVHKRALKKLQKY